MRSKVTRQPVNTGTHAQGRFTRMSRGVLDLRPSGYRNDHKKKADRFPCRKSSDLSSEFQAWKNTYIEEGKKSSQQNLDGSDDSA